jgi:hypothetical protein
MSRAERKQRARDKIAEIKKDLSNKHFTYTTIDGNSTERSLRMLDKWINEQIKKNPQEKDLWIKGTKKFAATLRGE